MPVYISILRGINVAGQKKIGMDELKTLFESLRFSDVSTYIQSGNVVFTAKETSIGALRLKIERLIGKKFGCDVPVQIRTIEEFKKVIDANPFVEDAKIDASKLHVTFLERMAAKHVLCKFENDDFKGEQFRVFGTEIYVHCPNGYSKATLTNDFFEKKLGISATTRSWNSVNKLYELAEK